MKYYKFGNKNGRYIGSNNKYDVYENTIASKIPENNAIIEKKPYEIYFNYGPSAGGLRESVNFSIVTPGETIRDITVNSHYKRRKIKIINDDINNALLKIERINGFHTASNTVCFLLAIEDALDIDNTGSNDKRIIEIELERIRSNIDVIKGLCESAGFSVPEKQLLYLREKITRIISDTFNHRYFFSANQINNVCGNFNKIRLNGIYDEFYEIYNSLLESKIFMDRIQENGIVNDINSSGPAARASGYKYDARIDSESLTYDNYNIYTMEEGDTFSRFMVRSNEVLASINIINKLLREIGNGKNNTEIKNNSGEGTARIESPQGDIFYYVNIEDNKIKDLSMVSPSYLNIELFKKAVKNNNILTDFFFVWESFGIWVSELEVDFI